MNISEITNMPIKPMPKPDEVLLVPEPPGEQKHWRDTATTFFNGGYFSRNTPEERKQQKSSLLTTTRSLTRIENNKPEKIAKYFRSKSNPMPVVFEKPQGFIQKPVVSLREDNGTSEKEAGGINGEILPTTDPCTEGSDNNEQEN
jgi:hypothetical protein